jgi:hypothetical protein
MAMNPSGFAVMLVAGIVLFVRGRGGSLALGVMAVGLLGLIVSSFGAKR